MPAEFRIRAIGGLVLVILPVLAFLAMFPAPGGLIFATVSTLAGFAAGSWMRHDPCPSES